MKTWILVLLGLLIACGLVVFGGIVAIDVMQDASAEVSNPVVDIYSPGPDDLLFTGQPVMLQAAARDPDGVNRIEFWVDGQLVKQSVSPWEKGITPLALAHSIRMEQAGQHQVVVRAFDIRGASGQSSMLLDFAQGSSQAVSDKYTVREGDTLEGIAAALGVSVEEIAAANPGIGDELPPAGEEMVLPTPAPEETDDAEPPAEPSGLPLDVPGFLWEPATPFYRGWLPAFTRLLDPLPPPTDLLDIALLETDAAYDGVHCYVSAGDSPVIRVPHAGFLTHLEGNYWDIAEWFSGDHMLPFLSSSGAVRLRMNCVGFYGSPTGGFAYDLGTLDVTRRIAEIGPGWINERTAGDRNWFRIQFKIQPLSEPAGFPSGYRLDLNSARYESGEDPLLPQPHAILQFRVYTAAGYAAPPVMDGFLIYRNGSLWRSTGPDRERYVVWDHILEAGGCGQETEFFVVGYMGNPLVPSTVVESPRIWITGYCPLDDQFKQVTVQFNWLWVYCLEGAESISTTGFGPLPACGGSGQPACTLDDMAAIGGCPSALDNYSPVSYGGLNVNGHRVIDLGGEIQFSPHYYYFLAHPWSGSNTYTLTLEPGDSLTVSTDLWDYDVLPSDDRLCPGTWVYSPDDLSRVAGSGERVVERAPLYNENGSCGIEFQWFARPFYAPAPSVVP